MNIYFIRYTIKIINVKYCSGSNKSDLDFHPFRDWDTDKWSERTSILDVAFHQNDIFYTPLIGNNLLMPDGIDREQYWYVKNEIVPAHVNHNSIGWYQKNTGALYIDTKRRRVQSKDRYGAKAQYDRRDTMLSRYKDVIAGALQTQLAYNIVAQTELVARNGILKNALHTYLYNGDSFVLGTADFSNIPQTEAGAFDITKLEDVVLRMAERSKNYAHKWGSYAQPVPGANFAGSAAVMVTTGTYWSFMNRQESPYMVDLRQMQDERIINGGKVQYRQFSTIIDTNMAQVLWNAGTLSKQVAVTTPIQLGDGAPDPETTTVDGVLLMGQEGATHYIQCTAFAAGEFTVGDRITLHTRRTADWGITDGVDWSDGKSFDMQIYSIDATNNRLTMREPITEEYTSPMSYTSLSGTASTGQCYAYVTKAQHIHPVIISAARESVQFVRRLTPNNELISYYTPTDQHMDYPSVDRVTAEWFGSINQWHPDVVEVYWCAGPTASTGAIAY